MERRGADRASEAARRRLELLARELDHRGGAWDAPSTAATAGDPLGDRFGDQLDDQFDEVGADAAGDGLDELWPTGMLPATRIPGPATGSSRRSRGLSSDSTELDERGWGRHRSGTVRATGQSPVEGSRPPLPRLSVLGDGVTPRHVGVAIVVVLLAAGAVIWWVLRAQPQAVVAEPVAPGASGSPSEVAVPQADGQPAAGAAVPGATAPAQVVVDVTGRVRRPGIVTLPSGSRVADAITAAGGSRRGADLSSVNLARVLVDGEQVVVGLPAVTGLPAPAPQTAPGGGPSGPGGVVNLNTATLEQLDTLPQVGPVTAQAILDWRTEHGRFTAVEELLEVRGIGDATLARLRDLVTV